MKQIILSNKFSARHEFCAGRMLAIWGLFGIAMAWLENAAGPSLTGQLAIWALGAISGLWIAAREL